MISQEDFRKAVEEKMKEKGLSFVLAIYQTLDEFLESEAKKEGVIFACKKGCSQCCYQLITCTEIEFEEIIRYVKGLPRENQILLKKRLRRFAARWWNYLKLHEAEIQANPFKQIQDWFGKACVFLNPENQSCDIYPVRIIDCRTIRNAIPCVTGVEPIRFWFVVEYYANNLILEEQKRKGFFGVTPILHWLLVKRFF